VVTGHMSLVPQDMWGQGQGHGKGAAASPAPASTAHVPDSSDARPMENRILKHVSCKQPEDVAVQFATSGSTSGSSGSKQTLNNNKINNYIIKL